MPKIWALRQRGFGGIIGRIYAVSPKQSEKYHLRMLLYHVSGATSFAHLKTVNGVQYATFQDAVRPLGLLKSDNQWYQCLGEALQIQLSVSLRKLFCITLVFCEPANPYQLWLKSRFYLSEDYMYQLTKNNYLRREFRLATDIEEIAYNNSVLDTEDILLRQYGSSLRRFSGFSLPNIDTRNNPEDTSVSRIFREQNALNATVLIRANAFDIDSFNPEQRHVFDTIIMESVYDNGYSDSQNCPNVLHFWLFGR